MARAECTPLAHRSCVFYGQTHFKVEPLNIHDKKDPVHIRPAVPPLFHCSDKVWPRKHGEEAVTICRRCFITGASRVTLVCWPAAVDGLPEIKSQQCLRFIWLGQKKTFFCLFSQKVHESKNKNEKQLYFYHAGQLKWHCCTAGRCYRWNFNDRHCGHSKCHMYRCYLPQWEVIHHIIMLSYNETHWAPLSSANPEDETETLFMSLYDFIITL